MYYIICRSQTAAIRPTGISGDLCLSKNIVSIPFLYTLYRPGDQTQKQASGYIIRNNWRLKMCTKKEANYASKTYEYTVTYALDLLL